MKVKVTSSSILDFDLEFRNGKLCRIILHLPHPSVGLTRFRKSRKEELGVQIDAGMNFFMWLQARDYNPTSFTKAYAIYNAPILEMRHYLQHEGRKMRFLLIEEYSSDFVCWARYYLRQDPQLITGAGKSLTREAADKVASKISVSQRKRNAEKLKRKAATTLATPKENISDFQHPSKRSKTVGTSHMAGSFLSINQPLDEKYKEPATSKDDKKAGQLYTQFQTANKTSPKSPQDQYCQHTDVTPLSVSGNVDKKPSQNKAKQVLSCPIRALEILQGNPYIPLFRPKETASLGQLEDLVIKEIPSWDIFKDVFDQDVHDVQERYRLAFQQEIGPVSNSSTPFDTNVATTSPTKVPSLRQMLLDSASNGQIPNGPSSNGQIPDGPAT